MMTNKIIQNNISHLRIYHMIDMLFKLKTFNLNMKEN